MSSHFILYRNSKIHYLKSGEGEKLVICFHGFDESAHSFEFLFPFQQANRTILAFDLPHHGLTEWKEGNDFSLTELKSILESCDEIQTRNFDLVGYSMGGRVSLALLEFMPEKINHVVLVAPDGIIINFWYWLSTQTFAGNRLFRYTMKHPQWFAGFLNFFGKLGIANESIARFVNRFLDDKSMRRKVYLVWTTMRKFKPHRQKIKTLVRKNKISIRLIYGKFDRIIRHENAKKLAGGIEEYCEINVLESGHQLLQSKHAAQILEALDK